MIETEERLELVDVLLFLGIGVPVFLLAMGLSYVAVKTAGMQAQGARLLIAQCLGYTAMLPVLAFILRGRHDGSPWQLLRLPVSLKQASTSMSLGIVTAFSVAIAAVLLRTPKLHTPMEDMLADPVSLAVASVLGVTVGPFFEELLFRGLLQPVLSRYMHAAVATILAALPFALLHGPQYAWSWRHVLLITAAGAAFGFRRNATDSVGAAAVMHGAYNLVLFAALLIGKHTI